MEELSFCSGIIRMAFQFACILIDGPSQLLKGLDKDAK